MSIGTFYGIGVGPGDPELITLQGKKILERCRYVFVPKARRKAESIALSIAKESIPPDSTIQEVVFPMVTDKTTLKNHWNVAATDIVELLSKGNDVAFLTLGDASLYSTHIYLVRALKERLPELEVVTVPGIAAFSAVAALTGFPVGEGKSPVAIIPTSDDFTQIEQAIGLGGTVVLMKVGKRLAEILDLLGKHELLSRSVFVARAGLDGERIETDLENLDVQDPHLGYLSVILVDARKEPQ